MPNAGGYARQELDPADANWNPITYISGSGMTSNVPTISWGAATAPWAGQVSGVAIMDSGVYGAGNMLFFGSLNVAKTVGQGDTFTFPGGTPGNLQVYMD